MFCVSIVLFLRFAEPDTKPRAEHSEDLKLLFYLVNYYT